MSRLVWGLLATWDEGEMMRGNSKDHGIGVLVFLLLVTAALAGVPSPSLAATGARGRDGNFAWIERADGSVTVTGYKGKGLKLAIPETLSGRPVRGIGDAAFLDCTSLISLTIPAGVTSIGYAAFDNCSSLTSVTIPAGVTSIGPLAFSYCSSLTAMAIPAGVRSIGSDAFLCCSALASVTIPAGVRSIGDYAFDGCSSLTSVTAPAGLWLIDDHLFDNCTSLTSVTLPAGIMWIGDYAFAHCSSLTSITIPADVTGFGEGAFSGPARKQFTFAGWFTAAHGGAPYRFATPTATDVTIWAHWKANVVVHKSQRRATYVLRRKRAKVSWTYAAAFRTASGVPLARKKVALQRSENGKKWTTVYALTTSSTGTVTKRLTFKKRTTAYWRWHRPSSAAYAAATGTRTMIVVR